MPQQIGYATLVTPVPGQTNANSETILTFTQQCDQVTVQNNSPGFVWVAFDGAVANGAKLVQPNTMLVESKVAQSVHLLTANAININGTTLPNIVILGEA
jgi:hypothetical protein